MSSTYTIALLSDIHGNVTALRTVLADAAAQGASQFWVLGDVFMPGPGTTDVFDMLDAVNTTAWVKGNWDDAILDVMNGVLGIFDAGDVYGTRLTMFVHRGLGDAGMARMAAWPMVVTRRVAGVTVQLTHNLPTDNAGWALVGDAPQANFEQLFDGTSADVAVTGHTHIPMVRPASDARMVVNPGSVGQPLWADGAPSSRFDNRAHYAIMQIGDGGVKHIDLRAVEYDVDAELELARNMELPYAELYAEALKTGVVRTHDLPAIEAMNEKMGYEEEVNRWLGARK